MTQAIDPEIDQSEWTEQQKADYATGKSVCILTMKDGAVTAIAIYSPMYYRRETPSEEEQKS
jgi:hypothetical protein